MTVDDSLSSITHVSVIGAGYVGGPIAAVFAAKCQHLDITVVDRDKQRIRQWNALEPPIHEPEIREILERHLGRNLRFTTDFDQAIARADMIFIAVNTPPKPVSPGSPYQDIDTSFVEQCVYDILSATRNTSGHKTIVQKSTVPCRTAQRIREIIDSSGVSLGAVRFDVLSNPEFLSEGTSIHNLSHPDRVLIGCDKTSSGLKAQEALAQLYANWVPKEKIITTDLWSSELAKLASNAMLAQRISTINSLSAVCEKLGSDVVDIAKACGADRRIGASYLNASIGFGGSCLEKDIMSLIWLCHGLDLPEVAEYWTQVLNINSYQGRRCTQMVADVLGGCISDKKLACLGYSFKKNTGDVRNSPAIAICGRLVEWGASLAIYDPMADPNEVMASLARYGSASGGTSPHRVYCAKSISEAVLDAHAVIVLTDWDEFVNADWNEIHARMRLNRRPVVFDGKVCLDEHKLHEIGFRIYTVGKPLRYLT